MYLLNGNLLEEVSHRRYRTSPPGHQTNRFLLAASVPNTTVAVVLTP
jgi:hypothetical protein